jgi:hypothetical protein
MISFRISVEVVVWPAMRGLQEGFTVTQLRQIFPDE